MSASVRSVAVRGAAYSFVRGARGGLQLIEPKLSGESDSLQLPGRPLRQFIQKDDATGHLVLCDPIGSVVPDLDFSRHMSRAQHDRGRHILAEAIVRNRERNRIGDRGMSAEDLVDFARRYFLAAAIDDLLETAGNEHVPIAIDLPVVAGAEPSVDERRAIGVRIICVARRHSRAAQNDFTDFFGRQQISLAIHYRDIGAGCAPDRTGFARGRRRGIGRDLMRRLGHSVRFEHRHAESLLHLRHQLGRQRRRARSDEAKLAVCDARRILDRPREHRLMHRRHCGVPRGRKFIAPIEKARGLEPGRAYDASAGHHRGEQRANEAVNMKQRHHVQAPIRRLESQRRGDTPC